MIRSHIGITPHLGPVEMAPIERIVAALVDACVPNGFTLIGLYLVCGVGYDAKNAGLLARVALLVALLEGPWIIAADWQMTPEQLQQTNWPRAVGGVICCCPHATCTMSNCSRNIDYFLISLDLAHRLESVELSAGHFRPHSPVCLCLSGTSCPQIVRTCVRPRKLPQDCLKRPTCAPAPPDWNSVSSIIQEAQTELDVSECWCRWLALAEAEALDLCDMHGLQRVAFVGRNQNPRFTCKH